MPRSNAFANCAYDSPFHNDCPLAVAFLKLGSANAGFCSSSATWSAAIGNGPLGLANPFRPDALKLTPYSEVPRVMSKHRCVPGRGKTAVDAAIQPLWAAGEGALPSTVMPYQILVM